MAIPQYDAAGDLLAWKLEHTAQEVDDAIDGLDAEVSARTAADNELKSDMNKVLPQDIASNAVRVAGRAIKSNGSPTNSADFDMVNYLDVHNCTAIIYGKWILAGDTPTSYGMAFYDNSGNYISGSSQALGYGATVAHYEMVERVLPDGAYYAMFTIPTGNTDFAVYDAAQVHNSLSFRVTELETDTTEMQAEINELKGDPYGTVVEGKVILWQSGVIDTFRYLNYREFEVTYGMKVKYSLNANPTFGLAFYDKNDAFIQGFSGGAETQYIDVPINATLCRATIGDITEVKIITPNNEELAGIINPAYISSYCTPLSAFDNITCCGDSLTYGVVYLSSSVTRQAKHPYPDVLATITGCSTENIAHGGYSASDWWGNYNDRIASKNNQLAIIYLGTNGGLTDTLSIDAPENTDPSTWADTNTGCYAKIVQQFVSVGAKIVLIEAGDSTTISVIRQIADRFHTGLIANYINVNPAYHYSPDLSYSNKLHYNDLGYASFAHFVNMQIANMNAEYMKYIIPS